MPGFWLSPLFELLLRDYIMRIDLEYLLSELCMADNFLLCENY